MISGSCEEARHAPDMGYQHLCLRALDGSFPIACQSTAATEPSPGQHLETLGGVLNEVIRPDMSALA